jgi:ABC-2 type transport system permease protein
VTRFVGTTALVRLILRRDRIRLPVWVLAVVGLVGFSAAAVQDVYATPEAQATYSRTVGNSAASIAMAGPPTAVDTLGGITVFEVALTAVIGVALMAIFLVLRHTRADEEVGRTELLRAGVMGRQADLLAVGLVVSCASLLVGAGVALSFLAAGLPTSGSLLYGASIACVGLVFVGVALVAAQVAEHHRAAVGLSLALLGGAFLLRAIGDVAENGVSWASPIGWAQASAAFGDERWWPLGLCVVGAVLLGALAAWLTTRRDIGGGLVASRPGPAEASPTLAVPAGMALRLQRTSVLGWGAGMIALGAAFGSLGEDVQELIESNPDMAEVFRRTADGASITDAFFATVMTISALVAAGFTVGSALRVRGEEAAARAEWLLATPLGRVRWLLSWLSVTLGGSVVVLACVGIGAGVSYAVVSGDADQVLLLTGAALTYLPAALVVGSVAVAVYGWVPRWSGVGWGVLAVCFVIGWLGEILELPSWAMDISPFTHTPQVPLDDVAVGPLLAIAAVAALLVAVGAVGLRRRDVVTE